MQIACACGNMTLEFHENSACREPRTPRKKKKSKDKKDAQLQATSHVSWISALRIIPVLCQEKKEKKEAMKDLSPIVPNPLLFYVYFAVWQKVSCPCHTVMIRLPLFSVYHQEIRCSKKTALLCFFSTLFSGQGGHQIWNTFIWHAAPLGSSRRGVQFQLQQAWRDMMVRTLEKYNYLWSISSGSPLFAEVLCCEWSSFKIGLL